MKLDIPLIQQRPGSYHCQVATLLMVLHYCNDPLEYDDLLKELEPYLLDGGMHNQGAAIFMRKRGYKTFFAHHDIGMLSPDIEKKRKVIEMILLSREMYASGDHKRFLTYIQETNDAGELMDFEKSAGMTVEEALRAEAAGKFKDSALLVFGAPLIKDPKAYAFVTEDFFFKDFLGSGKSILDPHFDPLWKVIHDDRFGGTTYLIGFEYMPPGGGLALATFGAILKDTGEWRALPVAAFYLE